MRGPEHKRTVGAALVVAAVAALVAAAPGAAYVGPGAGFALVSSCFVVFTTLVIALLTLLIWPFRVVWRAMRRTRSGKPRIKRLIVVGLDGQDPGLTDRFMREGLLPNFERLAARGSYHRLATTFPSVSPVAWSSFATGVHPAKHNIFDFLSRDLRTYLPLLSSTDIGTVNRFLRLGRYRVPLSKPELRLLRKSRPFWSILGDANVWSTVLRVPITFPPDRFRGAELAAMCVPDLLGTQGTFLLFTTRSSDDGFKEGGLRVHLERTGDRLQFDLEGPENVFVSDEKPMRVPITAEIDRGAGRVRLTVGPEAVELVPGELSGWVRLVFRPIVGMKVQGLCRMMVTEMDEHFSLYVTPISLDPEKPAMPVSHPSYYATYLAKRIGPFSTLGLAEDTWALNEEVIEDRHFLDLTWDVDRERRAMFFAALDRLRKGSLVCVFDATDRIQHMFWRYLEDGHPAAPGREEAAHRDAIEDLYRRNDELVGQVMDRLGPGDVLMVLSDHGFTSFRRGINLNAWLHEHGYLVLKEGRDGSREWLRDVDWSQTRAYALGLTGMYLNLRGREDEGIVAPGAEAQALKSELIAKLSGLEDPETGEVGITELFATAELYQGPYLQSGPDFLVGYNHGYRVSWDGATGVVATPVFEDNTKAWSGDHGVDPRLVPGVLFCSEPIDAEDPALIDIAPTALRLFGVPVPPYVDGRALFSEDRTFTSAGKRRKTTA